MIGSYAEALDFLYRSLPMFHRVGAAAYKSDMGVSLAIDAYDGHAHRSYGTIHVGGTNGKGSVSHLLASILGRAGYRVGLYTSPHLVDFRERIRVDGEPIGEGSVVEYLRSHARLVEDLDPSFFELTTGMALNYFREAGVDIAVVEVGLGGRLDSTNVIRPLVSIVTNVSWDHVALLGNSLEAIAHEKAGIAKSGVPLVLGRMEDAGVRDVFESRSRELGIRCVASEVEWCCEREWYVGGLQHLQMRALRRGEVAEYASDLLSPCLGENLSTVLSACDVLCSCGVALRSDSLRDGVLGVCSCTGLRGRWEWLVGGPEEAGDGGYRVVCDTGHNEAGLRMVVGQLSRECAERLHIVLGVVDDKDVSVMLDLLPSDAVYYFTRADVPRAMDAERLRERGLEHGRKGEFYESVFKGIEAALGAAGAGDLVFIGGSTFVVAEALTYPF